MSKIGFFGGAFNPPTKAHIELAKNAIKKYNLDKIIFVPVGDNYLKPGLANGTDRLKMLQIACEGNLKLEVSNIEVNDSKNYSAIDIFKIISDKYKNDTRYFIMGSDNLEKMTSWKNSDELVKDYNYIIFDRGNKAYNIIENNDILKNNYKKFNIMNNDDYNECSSTLIRTDLQNGIQPNNIDKRVYEYIKNNNIYKKFDVT